MKIAIVGLGGVGGYFGGRLTQTGHEVTFIARGDHLQAIRQNGLHVDSDMGDFVARPTHVTDNPADVGTVDVILVATKAWQVTEAAPAMQPMVGENTVIVPLLNGVEAPDMLRTMLNSGHVLGGFCRVQSRKAAAGHIVQGGTPPFVAFGELDGQPSEQVARVKALFDTADVTVQIPDNVRAAMWEKLLFISAFSGVGAVTRMPAGVIRSLPETRAMLEAAMTETARVARALSIPVADDAAAQGMALMDVFPPNATASMQRDIMDGFPSELEAQNGAVVRFGALAGVDTPTHRFLYVSLLPAEKKARGESI